MINKEDLRIGNYVDYEVTTHIVEGLMKENMIHSWMNVNSSAGDGYFTSYKDIEGIRITEDILKDKFKFVPVEGRDGAYVKRFQNINYEFHLGDYPRSNGNCGFMMYHFPEEVLDTYDEEQNPTTITTEEQRVGIAWSIYYVHQLQNLWYALTTEELKYE